MESMATAQEQDLDQLVNSKFQDFLNSFSLQDVENAPLSQNPRSEHPTNPMSEVDFTLLQTLDNSLAMAIQEQFYRFDAHYLRSALRTFVQTHIPSAIEESLDYYVSFFNMPQNYKYAS